MLSSLNFTQTLLSVMSICHPRNIFSSFPFSSHPPLPWPPDWCQTSLWTFIHLDVNVSCQSSWSSDHHDYVSPHVSKHIFYFQHWLCCPHFKLSFIACLGHVLVRNQHSHLWMMFQICLCLYNMRREGRICCCYVMTNFSTSGDDDSSS